MREDTLYKVESTLPTRCSKCGLVNDGSGIWVGPSYQFQFRYEFEEPDQKIKTIKDEWLVYSCGRCGYNLGAACVDALEEQEV